MVRFVIGLNLLLGLFFAQVGMAQTSVEALKTELTKQFEDNALPGAGVAIVKDGEALVQNGFGFAYLATSKKYSESTIQSAKRLLRWR